MLIVPDMETSARQERINELNAFLAKVVANATGMTRKQIRARIVSLRAGIDGARS